MEILVVLGTLLLAFGNGANDNFKGFATVWGSDTMSYRRALALATVATLAGSLVSLALAESLAQQFTGKGLVPSVVAGSPSFVPSVGFGAALTVMLATRLGLPVSTTHALIGGLVGAGLALNGGAVKIEALASGFLAPLLITPVVAALLGWLAWQWFRRRPQPLDCACIVAPGPDLAVADGTARLRVATPAFVIAEPEACETITAPTARVSISALADRVHVLSAASICFARGVNDTPKLTALLLAAQALNAQVSVLFVALAMAGGGLLFSRRVAVTMSRRLTRMDHTQGLAANLITAALVLFASKLGLPVSTTHVSVGSIAGVGAGTRTLNRSTLLSVLLSWVAVLPVSAATAWAAASLL